MRYLITNWADYEFYGTNELTDKDRELCDCSEIGIVDTKTNTELHNGSWIKISDWGEGFED